MTGSERTGGRGIDIEIGGSRIEAVPTRCGCAGKTPLNRIVRPALAAIRNEVSGIDVSGDLEAGLLPNTAGMDRIVVEAGRGVPNAHGSARFVAVAFVDSVTGGDTEAFQSLLSNAYGRWAGNRKASILKGHSIQVETDEGSIVWGESIRPTGRRRAGYRTANVDVIHAFPDIDPETQAAIASAHAFNDCYTQGAAAGRDLRPVVGVPRGIDIDTDLVREWYIEAVESAISVREPSIVTHDGRGWQFGASVVASTARIPPVRIGSVTQGDEVVLHRPLGALALFAGCVGLDRLTGSPAHERAIEALSKDHVAVAEAIAATCPRHGEAFDPDRHLKWAGDVSGPGIRGLVETTRSAGCGIRLPPLPLLDRPALDAIRDRWIVPDVTVETNGPIAAIGRPAALRRLERRFANCPSADPERIGVVTASEGELGWNSEVNLERYLEIGSTMR